MRENGMRVSLFQIRYWRTALSLLTLIGAIGCGRSDDLSSPTAAKLRALTSVYLDFAAARGVGPASESELLAHWENLPWCQAQGCNPEAALRSDRDGKPFVIHYGQSIWLSRKKSAPPIAHERDGQAGTVLVGYANGIIASVDKDTDSMKEWNVARR
jgi:hypothetical protein